ncbi:MAG: ABC transporter ATP-binding protein [Anaerolineae bacterium]|nr:MAG: ABC transporter ATP-binding protein [Anaerolineae bacterium]
MFRQAERIFGGEVSKPVKVSVTLRRFAGYFRPYLPQYLIVLVMMIVSTWSQATAPRLIGQAVDCYLLPLAGSGFAAGRFAFASGLGSEGSDPGAGQLGGLQSNCTYVTPKADWTEAEMIAGLGGLVSRIVGLYLIGALSGGLMFYVMVWSGQHVLKMLRVQVLQQINRLSIGYHVEHEAGDTMSRVTNDADTIQQGMTFALVQVASGLMLIIWISYNMLTASLPYALVALSIVPVMAIATSWFSTQARKAFRRTRLEMGSVNAELQESIAGVRESQAFSREDENIASFRETNAANRDANIRAVAFTSALAPALEALGYVALMLVTVVGGIALLRGQDFFGTAMSFGLIVTFVAYVQSFNRPVQQIAVLWTNVQSAIAGGERIFDLLDVVPDIQDGPDAVEMPEIEGAVELEGVWSEYVAGDPVLKGVSLRAEPGQTLAIVGPTGAGKTTIVNLIPRFYDVTKGSVRIDGLDVRKVTAASLRSQIAVVLQDSFLFSDTVMENIRFGRPEATDQEILAAAKLAHADPFIERLPQGYQTRLGERGTGLSQGQRQLLAIARAAVADPRILILDEATSSVDTRTERLIQAALAELLHGRTSIVIAHRLSTIRNADQVLVIDQGEIIERGTHDTLLAARGFYSDLYMSQFRRQAPDDRADGKEPGPAAAPARG